MLHDAHAKCTDSWWTYLTSTVCVFKSDVRLQKSFHCCSAFPVQMQLGRHKHSSRRHKRSPGRSVSEPALRFGNLCVYEPSTLQKKPSMWSPTLNWCREGCTTAILFTATMPDSQISSFVLSYHLDWFPSHRTSIVGGFSSAISGSYLCVSSRAFVVRNWQVDLYVISFQVLEFRSGLRFRKRFPKFAYLFRECRPIPFTYLPCSHLGLLRSHLGLPRLHLSQNSGLAKERFPNRAYRGIKWILKTRTVIVAGSEH